MSSSPTPPQATPSQTSGAPPLAWHDRLVLTLTSAFGLGYAPWAPGTCGTLAALPLWYLAADVPLLPFSVGVVLATCVAVGLSARAERIYGAHDVQKIVVDEVVGFLCTVLAVPFTPMNALVAFVVFRLLDAGKPGPIGWVDRHVHGGLGVVLDDVAAGLAGCAVLHGAHAAGLLAW